jgi:hypothetical protein
MTTDFMMSLPSNGTCEAQFKTGHGNRNVAERRAALIVPKNLDEMSTLRKHEVRRDVGWTISGPRQQLKYRRFESETPRLFHVQRSREAAHTKNVVERSVLRRGSGARSAQENG